MWVGAGGWNVRDEERAVGVWDHKPVGLVFPPWARLVGWMGVSCLSGWVWWVVCELYSGREHLFCFCFLVFVLL